VSVKTQPSDIRNIILHVRSHVHVTTKKAQIARIKDEIKFLHKKKDKLIVSVGDPTMHC
jgi:hypothetical protein